jgi:GNAT superfamily N-acetyltransferase
VDRRLYLRSYLERSDETLLLDMASCTYMFHSEEVQLLSDIFFEHNRSPQTSCYKFLILEAQNRDSTNSVIGFTCFGHIHGTENRYTLYWIVVDRAEQAKGYGSALLSTTEKIVRSVGGRRLYLETSSKQGYVQTRKFYQSNGYYEDAHVSQYYNDYDDLVYFRKNL